MACFVHAFTLDAEDLVDPPQRLPDTISHPGDDNCIIPSSDPGAYDSEPLAQQAVLHVVTSLAAAICHLLQKPVHREGGTRRSEVFAGAVSYYLVNQLELKTAERQDDWRHREDVVVQAIKGLLREAPVDFFALREDVVRWSKRHSGLSSEVRRFFGHICPDDVCQVRDPCNVGSISL
jgi:hypothetical protein